MFKNEFIRKNREIILLLMDTAIVVFSFLFSLWAKKDFSIEYSAIANHYNLIGMMVMTVFAYIISFLVFKVYKSLWKYIGILEIVRIACAVALATLIMCILAFTQPSTGFRISILVFTAIISLLLMCNVRLTYRIFRNHSVSSNKRVNSLIVGAGDGGYILLKELIQNTEANAKVIGFIDDYKKGKIVHGVNVIGSIDELEQVVKKEKIKRVYIAMPSVDKNYKKSIIKRCQEMGIEIKLMKINNILENNNNNTSIQDVSIEDLLGRGEIKLDQKELNEYIETKNILVTGAGGSIGSELCRQIVKFKPNKLIMLDINENSLYMLEQEFNRMREHKQLDKNIKIISYIASIRDVNALESIIENEKLDVVYHAAAHKHVPLMETRPMEAIKNNVFGTKNVIQTCIKYKVPRFIMISTDKAVNPTNVMGATKRMTEMILQSYGDNGVTKMAAVRFGNVLGSNGSVIPIFKQQILEGGPVTITDKRIIRYFMTIPEASQLVLQAGYYADKGEIFVLDMGEPVKIIDLAENLIRLSGKKPYEDIEIKEIGLRPGEKMYEELHLDDESFSKTENELIFRNDVLKIPKEELEEKLDVLSKLISVENDSKQIREIMLKLIV